MASASARYLRRGVASARYLQEFRRLRVRLWVGVPAGRELAHHHVLEPLGARLLHALDEEEQVHGEGQPQLLVRLDRPQPRERRALVVGRAAAEQLAAARKVAVAGGCVVLGRRLHVRQRERLGGPAVLLRRRLHVEMAVRAHRALARIAAVAADDDGRQREILARLVTEITQLALHAERAHLLTERVDHLDAVRTTLRLRADGWNGHCLRQLSDVLIAVRIDVFEKARAVFG
jgi:hypothetical protein